MKRDRIPEPIFDAAVIRGMFDDATSKLQDPKNIGYWDGHTLGRFATWAAAVEGIVELLPEVLQFFSVAVRRDWGDTYADYHGPLQALEALIKNADPPEWLFAHGSAHVRHMLAEHHSTPLQNDRDPVVRAQARHRYEKPPTQPWWVGVLPERPPEQREVLEFGTLAAGMYDPYHFDKGNELIAAFGALSPDLSGRIARFFLTPLWGHSTWTERVWKALVQAPLPLAERLDNAQKAIADLLLPSGFPRPHHDAMVLAIEGCPQHEQRELAALLVAPRERLEPPTGIDEHAAWAMRRRRRRSASRARDSRQSKAFGRPAAPFPSGLLERLIHEVLQPGAWGQDRFALHPRARWELGRGLKVLDVRAAALQDREATLLELADLVAVAREERPQVVDATQLALAGLLGALEATDPIFETLASDAEPMLREAAALGLAGASSPLARKLLADDVPEVWTAARIAIPDAEPWRGPLVQDPFAGRSTQEAEALVPKIIGLAEALPRVRYHSLQNAVFVRLASIAAALPAPHGLTLALRLIPVGNLHKRLAPLVIAILGAEGGFSAWAAVVDKRLKRSQPQAVWLGKSLVRFAMQGEFRTDGDAPLRLPPEQRSALADHALARYTHTLSQDVEVAALWLATAAALWLHDRDPLPLPGPWRERYPEFCVCELLATMSFGPDWPVTQALLEGGRHGFPKPWGSWSHVADVIARLPETMRTEIALEGFWRDGEFGQWARQRLGEQLSRTRIVDQTALHTLLSDPRLASEHLVPRNRTKHTLFVRRARLAAGLADFAEGLSTLSAIAAQAEVQPWTADEIQGWRSRWMEAIQQAMAAGPGGPRGVFVTLAPPGLWEEIDRTFVHSVAHDATPQEAQAIARRLAACGNAEDLTVARELSECHPAAAAWPELLESLGRGT